MSHDVLGTLDFCPKWKMIVNLNLGTFPHHLRRVLLPTLMNFSEHLYLLAWWGKRGGKGNHDKLFCLVFIKMIFLSYRERF